MREKKGGSGLTLSLLISLVVFAAILVAIAFALALVSVAANTDWIPGLRELFTDPQALVWFVAGVSVLVGAALTVFASWLLMKPIKLLVSKMNLLADGNFTTRIDFGAPLGRSAAVQELITSFNALATELESTEMLRSDFVNNFSHEFKTPIVSISGFAKLLRRGNVTESQREEYLAAIEEESLRLAAMANNVLELTKVENQTILSEVEEYNLSEQVRSCILLLAPKWEKKELDFCLEFGEHMVTASEELLKHVWLNLLDNAVKFSPAGGTVEVRMGQTAETVSVSVLNRGPEIPKEEQTRIFRKFYQADKSHAAEGNGVGLAVVKQVVDLHRGTVKVKSENGVTVFTVTLPR